MDEFKTGDRALLYGIHVAPELNNHMVTITGVFVDYANGETSYWHTIDGYGSHEYHSRASVLHRVSNDDKNPVSQDSLMEILNG